MAHTQSEFKERLEATLRRGNPLINSQVNRQPQLPPANQMQMSNDDISQHSSNLSGSSNTNQNNFNVAWPVLDPSSEGQVHKRKLDRTALTLQSSECPHISSNVMNTFDAPACKSPKVLSPGYSRVWTPAMCSICMEDLFSYVESTPSEAERYLNFFEDNRASLQSQTKDMKPTVSTRCGHLFHTECINKWFLENKEKEIKECPYCKREMMANDTTRIFPVFGDD